MKSYIHIAEKIFRQPWLIKPSMHQSIARQFLAHIAKAGLRADVVDDDADVVNDDADTVIDDTSATQAPLTSPVAIVMIDGIIGKHLSSLETMCGGADLDSISEDLKAAKADPNVQAVLLYINSPGGTVTGVQEVGELIAELDKVKPVFAFTDTQACSAAYWLASQARAVFCAPSSDVGSVGVYMMTLDESKALEDEGIKVNAFYAGKFKLAGASFKPMTEDEAKMFQAGVDKLYSKFTAAVNSKRSVAGEDMQGQVFDGEEAVNKGLADGLANNLDEALNIVHGAIGSPIRIQ